jgi:hypothetical protein
LPIAGFYGITTQECDFLVVITARKCEFFMIKTTRKREILSARKSRKGEKIMVRLLENMRQGLSKHNGMSATSC